jgi:hypothetical protein
MKSKRTERFSEEELRALGRRLDARQLQPEDYPRLAEAITETKRMRRRLWWMALAERSLLRMLAVKNWIRRLQGKPPLVVEEWDDNGR